MGYVGRGRRSRRPRPLTFRDAAAELLEKLLAFFEGRHGLVALISYELRQLTLPPRERRYLRAGGVSKGEIPFELLLAVTRQLANILCPVSVLLSSKRTLEAAEGCKCSSHTADRHKLIEMMDWSHVSHARLTCSQESDPHLLIPCMYIELRAALITLKAE